MTDATNRTRTWIASAALIGGGVLVGAVLAGTMAANASTTTPSPSATAPGSTGASGQSGTAPSGGPGVQENDGIPESQEQHGGPGHGLDLSGTVTAVGTDTVTIKTSTGTTAYKVTSTSDIDKNGEATLSDLVVGDAVHFSVETGTTTIDKLHAGDESKDMPAPPQGGQPGGPGGNDGPAPSSSASSTA